MADRRRERLGEAGFWLGLLLLAAAIVALLFRRQFPALDSELIGAHNDVVYSFSTMRWQWHALLSGRPLELLNAPIMAPLPHGHAFGDNLFALTLLGLPLAAAGHDVLAYNAALLATFVLCVLFGAGFARALTGSRAAAVFAGVAFALVPARLSTLFHVNNLAVMGCALAAWALVRWHQTRSWRWAVIGGLAAYVQFLSSIQLYVHLVVLGGVWLVGLWGASGLRLRRREVVQAGVVVAMQVILLAPWARVYARARQYLPAARSTDEMFMYRPRLSDWLDRLSPGTVVTVLLVVALMLLVARWVRRGPGRVEMPEAAAIHLPWLLLLVAAGVVLSLGPHVRSRGETTSLPYYWAMRVVPLLTTIRVPQRIQRVVALFATGAASVALAWLGAWLGTWLSGWRRWGRLSRRSTPVLAALAVVTVVAASPPVTEATRAPPALSFAPALARLPAHAVVFPIPLELNWPRRPPLDFAAIVAERRMVGGYGGAIPNLFWALQKRVDSFPQPGALAAVRASGATHLLVDKRGTLAIQREAFAEQAATQRVRRLFEDGRWQLWQLHHAAPRLIDPLRQAAESLRLRGPSRVAAGQRVTLALEVTAAPLALDPVVRRQVEVEIVDEHGRPLATQVATLQSPMVVDPGGHPYQLALRAPSSPGTYTVRLAWPACPTCPSRGQLELPLVVDAELATSAARPVRRAALRETGRPATVIRGRHLGLRLSVRNEDDFVWLATSDKVLPADAGAVILHASFGSAKGVMVRSYPPFQHHALLPHDLAPGDEVELTVHIEAPGGAGDHDLALQLSSYQVAHGARSDPVRIEPSIRVE